MNVFFVSTRVQLPGAEELSGCTVGQRCVLALIRRIALAVTILELARKLAGKEGGFNFEDLASSARRDAEATRLQMGSTARQDSFHTQRAKCHS